MKSDTVLPWMAFMAWLLHGVGFHIFKSVLFKQAPLQPTRDRGWVYGYAPGVLGIFTHRQSLGNAEIYNKLNE